MFGTIHAINKTQGAPFYFCSNKPYTDNVSVKNHEYTTRPKEKH